MTQGFDSAGDYAASSHDNAYPRGFCFRFFSKSCERFYRFFRSREA
jgi:hypothetical protein